MNFGTSDDLEIIGLVNHHAGAVGDPPSPVDFDAEHIRHSATSQENAGYDRVLIANAATMPESFSIGAYLSGVTSRLGFLLAHRPGVVPPTTAARNLATLDRLSGGRAAVHIIAGADDREVQADGLFNTKEERYHIAAEYVEVMRKVWASAEPFDFDGEFYKFRGAYAMVKPKGGAIPVYWAGTSDLAIDLCGKVADVYALGGDTFDRAGTLATKAYAAAEKYGREIKVLMTMVIIVADTEEDAWAKAQMLYEKVELQVANGNGAILAKHEKIGDKPAAGAFRRMMDQSKEGDRLDRCLWTGLNKAYKGRGNNSVLVGTAEQIADSLMEYRRLGVTRFLLRAPDQDVDAAKIGSTLVPELREKIAQAMAKKQSA
ncbi:MULTISPECIES: LLM class flavin-dependent oxidoreductase [Aliiglaciecola]|uniref:LLM class flavin-dependent oxidoreductase n=1 Tax=Aliiglaciecola TaxID=1406885 RepID=UPI001C081454|nr:MULTISPECIES: LLM class flavin-dependent oxidoreductase [Aliiglaciecola]MBU2878997.1 LLM class flavin-dependent oxidoreductase [Aliiglaciecola lipolytica]MDO6710695.1 LLM class flavin-dependent oxidoreductase [Aliiglaciecola sp. 2_MG-2023]MDO6751897.1 LLM class flavin-dependent oxidoreductase [Aliiglaciecola sp. 1_MG-2023]